MTRLEAHALLDAATNGYPMTRGDITEALMFTGDLTRWRATQLDKSEEPQLPQEEPTEQERRL